MKTSERASYAKGNDLSWSILCREDKEQLDRIERLLNSSINLNMTNPFCENCLEQSCAVAMDGTCSLIRSYLGNK